MIIKGKREKKRLASVPYGSGQEHNLLSAAVVAASSQVVPVSLSFFLSLIALFHWRWRIIPEEFSSVIMSGVRMLGWEEGARCSFTEVSCINRRGEIFEAQTYTHTHPPHTHTHTHTHTHKQKPSLKVRLRWGQHIDRRTVPNWTLLHMSSSVFLVFLTHHFPFLPVSVSCHKVSPRACLLRSVASATKPCLII